VNEKQNAGQYSKSELIMARSRKKTGTIEKEIFQNKGLIV